MAVVNLETDDPTLVNRYLADQLSESEREAFEAELVRKPERLQELEATARVKIGLTRLRARGELDSLLQPARALTGPMWLAVAAALTMFVLGVVLFRVSGTPAESALIVASAASLLDQRGDALPVGMVQTMFRSRAEAAEVVVEQSQSSRALEFRVLPPQAQPAQYAISLSRLTDDGVAVRTTSLKNLHPKADGFISVYADTARLEPGRYRLSVTPEAAAQSTDGSSEGESFLIRVTPSGVATE